ncbi:MAG: hypothetical protein RJA94_2981 [Pseudomonadota bacterium]
MGRGLLIWFVIMLVETLHGVLRGALVVPRIGATAAERVGWPVAAVLVLVISVLLIRWTGIRGTAPLLRLGAAWAVLTVGFEWLVGVLRGLDVQALLAALDPRSGTVAWSAALMLLTPLLAAWLRGLR